MSTLVLLIFTCALELCCFTKEPTLPTLWPLPPFLLGLAKLNGLGLFWCKEDKIRAKTHYSPRYSCLHGVDMVVHYTGSTHQFNLVLDLAFVVYL